MAGEEGSVPPPPQQSRSTTSNHRRRHRRGQGRQRAERGLTSGEDNGVSLPNFSMLPGSGTLCREANEAHVALLSTLPPHMAISAGLLCGECRQPNEQQQIQNDKMIREFKTMPCGLEATQSTHDHRCCPFFHSERDRRRIVLSESGTALYAAEPCDQQFDDQRQCSNGDSCGFCHSTAELLYHPDFFRKRLCHQAKRCPRGRFCAFAHSRQELLVPHFTELEELEPTEDFIAWRFKTQWCPIGGPHDWENCVYAHTYRDWRRVPTLGYSSRPCPHWVQSVTTGPAELLYADRCPRGMSCPLAHGAKEQLYHPQFYKTSPCSEANCKRGALCAFTHGSFDIRRPRADDPMPSALREPILQAVELLGRSQPTFWSPPRYHALEEPPRQTQSSKGRSRGGSNALQAALQQQQQDIGRWFEGRSEGCSSGMDPLCGPAGPLLPPALPSVPGGSSESCENSPSGYSPYMSVQYPLCQWVPMGSEPMNGSQLIPPSMGYGGQTADMSPWGMPMGYAPWGVTYMHPNGQSGMQPGMPTSPFMMPLPASPHHSEQANIGDEAAVEKDGKMVDGSPQGSDTTNAFGMPPVDISEVPCGALSLPDLSRSLLGGVPPWPAVLDESYLARQHSTSWRELSRKGLRTPSSLGSPPLSAAPTEAPTPRAIEADSNGPDGSVYQDGSSDDNPAGHVEAVAENFIHGFHGKDFKEMPAIVDFTIAAGLPQGPIIEPEPFAIQNFVEAPCPASPSR